MREQLKEFSASFPQPLRIEKEDKDVIDVVFDRANLSHLEKAVKSEDFATRSIRGLFELGNDFGAVGDQKGQLAVLDNIYAIFAVFDKFGVEASVVSIALVNAFCNRIFELYNSTDFVDSLTPENMDMIVEWHELLLKDNQSQSSEDWLYFGKNINTCFYHFSCRASQPSVPSPSSVMTAEFEKANTTKDELTQRLMAVAKKEIEVRNERILAEIKNRCVDWLPD